MKNLEINLNKFPIENRILYITGLSGSGKTTTAHQYKEKMAVGVVELDMLFNLFKEEKSAYLKTARKLYSTGYEDLDYQIFEVFLPSIPAFYFNKMKEYKNYFRFYQDVARYISDFSKQLVKIVEEYTGQFNMPVIIEGYQLVNFGADYFKDKSLLILGTGFLKSNFRAIKRVRKRKDLSIKTKIAFIFGRFMSLIYGPIHKSYKQFKRFKKRIRKTNI